MKVLITGGAGFIGSNLCEKLLQKGVEVVCLDNFNRFYDQSLKRENVSKLQSFENFRLIESDILDTTRLKSFCSAEKVDAVIHLAAYPGNRRSVENPSLYEENNIRGTLNILNACLDCGIKKFILGSSYTVYGSGLSLPFKETQSPQKLLSPLAVTKSASENFSYVFHHIHGLDVTVLRYFTVYGPKQRPGSAVYEFVKSSLNGEPIKRIGKGEITRDFIFVDDAVEATIKALEKTGGFEIYNIGSGTSLTIDQFLKIVSEVTGNPLQIIEEGDSPAIMPDAVADITKAKLKLGWKPTVEIHEGIIKLVKWMAEREKGSGGGNGTTRHSQFKEPSEAEEEPDRTME